MKAEKSTRVFAPTARNLVLLARRLQAGELVAAPTETVYGLAANAFDAKACRRIFTAKRRPATDPLIVHLFSAAQLPDVCVPNEAARRLAAAFWPGPLTIVLPRTAAIPDVVTGGRDSVAVRMPAHRLFRRLLKLAGVPLAAPSANPFGYVSPTTAGHVHEGLGRRIGYILDGGPTPIGLESTIVDLRDERHPRLLRPGAVTRADLERVLKRPVAAAKPARAAGNTAQVAPGMLKRHYSPHTPIELHERLRARESAKEAFVFFRRPMGGRHAANIFWLDPRGDVRAAGRRLFALLRQLDRAGYARLHVELAPGDGLAEAINDRLRRAAAR
ncbi:MAG TPA: L-threonylcarbamoyladenylate synthase [Opitutaceae bacterium]|nr:L-threonylcarbamoyladenylate synthase [Opitutaceae bacterium]